MDMMQPLPWQAELWQQVVALRARQPHALLLYGGRGIGKRHFAQALAQSLLCEAPEAGRPRGLACGHCAGCQLLAADNHPDLRWLVPAIDRRQRGDEAEDTGADGEQETIAAEPAGKGAKLSREIRIDQVRAIGEFLAMAAHRGRRRVVLVWPAESLNAHASNALLKILEEPPAGALFIAVTDELDAVLPTVRSRCVLLRAPVPDPQAALAWLRERGVADAEDRLAEAGGAPMGLAPPVDGAEADPRVLSPDLHQKLLEMLARGLRLEAADIASAVPREIPVGAAIRLFQRWGWDLLAERTAGRVRYHPRHQRVIASIARAVQGQPLLGWLDQLSRAQRAADHPLNARLAVESALLGYRSALHAESSTQAQDTVRKVQSL